MSDMAEDRVYDDRADGDVLFVASATGVTRVAVANGRVGRFSLERRCTPRDLAAGPDWVAVATETDVLLRREDGEYRETGYGPAVAAGADGDDLLVAGPDGELARRLDVGEDVAAFGDDPDDGEWLPIADVDAPVRAIDRTVVAAGDGVYRLHPDGLDHAGLDDARDVVATPTPLVATGTGLYRLGNGWLEDLAGEATLVAGGGDWAGTVVDGHLYVRERPGEDWTERAIPARPAALCRGERTYAVTDDGTVCSADVDAPDGWRRRALGLPDVVDAVVGGTVPGE